MFFAVARFSPPSPETEATEKNAKAKKIAGKEYRNVESRESHTKSKKIFPLELRAKTRWGIRQSKRFTILLLKTLNFTP